MRIIPKKTKVSTEFFRGVSLADVLVGFFGVLVIFFVFLSSLPYRLWIDLGLLFLFGFLLARIDDEPNYMFLFRMLRHFSYVRRYQKIPYIPVDEREDPMMGMNRKQRRAYRRKKKKERKQALKRKKQQEKQKKKQQKQQKKNKGKVLEDPEPEEPLSEEGEQELTEEEAPPSLTRKEKRAAKKAEKKERKRKKKAKKAEDKFLKDKKIPEADKTPIRERRKREAEERYYKAKVAEQRRKRVDIQRMYLVTEILDGFICYSGQYYGAVIEIPPVEFRFFSEHRQSNAIDRALGGVIRSVGPKYAANLVKLERPMVLDEYIDGEYDKIDALKKGYERGVFSEEELKARIEVIYDRINQLRQQNLMDKVLIPHFYLVLFDSDKRQLENQMRSAITSLTQGEMVPHRLNDKELAVFLRYVNSADFDEREIEDTDPADYALFAMPESLELKHRTADLPCVQLPPGGGGRLGGQPV